MDIESIDPYVFAAVGAAVLIAIVWLVARGVRRDSMLDLARWCEGRGLRYVADAGPLVVGRFDGEVEGIAVAVEVRTLPARALIDLPPKMTRLVAHGATGAGRVLVQPAEWVMRVDGTALPPRQPVGSAQFAAQWAVYADDAGDAHRAVPAAVQRRLMHDDAAGLAVEWHAGAVITEQPGVVADTAELDRRLAVLVDIVRGR